MPAIVPLVINDGKATPTAHTFAPQSTDGSSAQFLNRSASFTRGMESLAIEVVMAKSATSANRVHIAMSIPVVETVAGVATVTRRSAADLWLNFGQDSTLAERKDLRVLLINALSKAEVITAIENVEPFY